ncbi:MAG: hypothetical protein DHS20C01_03310 [marine bacterium B5-7]|nr:MAG: hypothetical protein DHS20C01_03310 [marine bacterium B5-7]
MNDSSDKNPTHYDDLIRELNELKRFIEQGDDDGDNAPGNNKLSDASGDDDDPVIAGSHANAGPAHPHPSDSVATNSMVDDETIDEPEIDSDPDIVDTDSSDADEFPTLNEVVRRPQSNDEFQLDLLSPTQSIESTKPSPDKPTSQEAVADPPIADKDSATENTVAGLQHPATTDNTIVDDNQPATQDDVAEGEGDDEILEFVLDLSERIMGTIEDRLLERSGELIPDDLRDELRESIGDILYEWCER